MMSVVGELWYGKMGGEQRGRGLDEGGDKGEYERTKGKAYHMHGHWERENDVWLFSSSFRSFLSTSNPP